MVVNLTVGIFMVVNWTIGILTVVNLTVGILMVVILTVGILMVIILTVGILMVVNLTVGILMVVILTVGILTQHQFRQCHIFANQCGSISREAIRGIFFHFLPTAFQKSFLKSVQDSFSQDGDTLR
jgi:hypothetical protein